MKKIRFAMRLTLELRDKLFIDSARNGFPSATSYLHELIKRGLPINQGIDEKLKEIQQQIASLSRAIATHDTQSLSMIETNHKSIHMTYRAAYFSLARSFLLHPGEIGVEEIEKTNVFFEHEDDEYEKQYCKKIIYKE